ncbi:MAG: ATP-grasp domain-containing protein, partial [Candidatus Binatia bacterium]
PFESVGSEIQEEFMPPFFVKPAAEEGSWGIEMIENLDDLQSTLKVALSNHDILVQEYLPGQEVAVTLFKDSKDKLHALPATLVVPQKAAFYDHLSKRIPGRAVLHTPDRHNTVSEEAEAIARGVYEELGCEGIVTVDMIAGDHLMDVLEINTIPSFGGISPLVHQLRAAGYHPSQILDEYIRASI